MNISQIVVLILVALFLLMPATWRIANLLTDEIGPFRVLEKVRSLGWGAFDCLRCMSVWIGVFLAVAYFFSPTITFWFSLPFALSAGAILFDRYGG